MRTRSEPDAGGTQKPRLVSGGVSEAEAEAGQSRRAGLASDQIGIQFGDESVGNGVGNRIDALDDGQAIADLAHDCGYRSLERFGNRGENLARRLFLTALYLTEIPSATLALLAT